MTLDDIRAMASEENVHGPDWFVSEFDRGLDLLRSYTKVQHWEFGRSAGDRPMIAAAYGEPEPPVNATSVSYSACGWSAFNTFFGEQPRQKQVFCFVGNIHGAEVEGSVGALNLLHLLEHGVDLRGKEWPRLLEEARKMRIVVVLHANPDGRARNPLNNMRLIHERKDLGAYLTFGAWDDGKPFQYSDSKKYFPMPIDRMARIGSYFNDNGVNLVHDNVFCSTAQPESRALADLYLAERPDCVILSHTNAGSLGMNPSPYLPPGVQHRQSQLSCVIGLGLHKLGRARNRIAFNGPGEFLPPTFHHEHVPYFVCGGVPLLVEYPCGYTPHNETFDELLDYGLQIFEELFVFGNEYGFRPTPPIADYATSPFTGRPLRERK